jgi:hypothetical protein
MQWNELVRSTVHVRLTNDEDLIRWNLHQNGQFIVHYLYLALINNEVVERNQYIWKLKIPLKNKIFMWYLHKVVILTKDILVKRNCGGSKQCSFCMANKTIQHLFFDCINARFLWGIVYITSGLREPHSRRHMLGSWLNRVGTKLK